MEPISRHFTEKLVSKILIFSTFVTYEQYDFMNNVISVSATQVGSPNLSNQRVWGNYNARLL